MMKTRNVLIIVAGIILAAAIGFSTTITKGLIGKQDISLWDGTTTNTFTRESSEGYTLTLNQLDWPGVDVFQVYGAGVNRNAAALSGAATAAGSTKTQLWLSPGTWTIDDDVTLASNISLVVPSGAVLTVSSGKTLTINGNLAADTYQIFAGTGAVTIGSRISLLFPEWWGAAGDGSTDDDAEMTLCVAQASGKEIYFTGTYLITGGITNLHSTRKAGPGALKLGSDTFYVRPISSTTNKLYVDASGGNDSNSGLASTDAFATLQQAFTTLTYYGPVVPGTSEIVLAAATETLTSAATIDTYLRFDERLYIHGPAKDHPSVPTAILDCNDATSSAITGSRTEVLIEDVKVQNCTGYAIYFQDQSNIHIKNVHGYSNAQGDIKVSNGSQLRLEGGIFDGDSGDTDYSIVGVSDCILTVGYNGTNPATDGPQISDSSIAGVYFAENSSGHVDYTEIDNCGKGVYLMASRANVLGSDIKNNDYGIFAGVNSQVYNNTSYPNTFTSNTVDVFIGAAATEATTHETAQTEYRVLVDNTGGNHTGDTSWTVVGNTWSCPAKYFVETGKKIKVKASGRKSGTAGNSSIGMSSGGSLVAEHELNGTAAGTFVAEFELFATGSATQDYAGHVLMDDDSADVLAANTTDTVDFDATSRAIGVMVKVYNSGDTIYIDHIEIWITG